MSFCTEKQRSAVNSTTEIRISCSRSHLFLSSPFLPHCTVYLYYQSAHTRKSEVQMSWAGHSAHQWQLTSPNNSWLLLVSKHHSLSYVMNPSSHYQIFSSNYLTLFSPLVWQIFTDFFLLPLWMPSLIFPSMIYSQTFLEHEQYFLSCIN